MLIANSNLVGRWATWEHFRELERAGLMMYGQMTAGSWIYIGSQGIVQGTYETFGAVARHALRRLARRPARRHGGTRRHGRRAAARRDDAGRRRCSAFDVDESRIDKRLATRLLRSRRRATLDEALGWLVEAARREGRALSVGRRR